MEEINLRKLLSALCHGSTYFCLLSIILPIIILKSSSDPVVRKNAKEAINYPINYCLCSVILFFFLDNLILSSLSSSHKQSDEIFFTFFVLSYFLKLIAFLLYFIFSIIATMKVLKNPDNPYRYRLVFRFIK
jgi:uncharacterized protein